MNNRFKRSIHHLEDKNSTETIINTLQAVEDLFTETWLNENNGNRLQILWARRDHLSTTELFFLGRAIVKLSRDNRTWLESTAREIKKDSASSHGLITEIITIGSLSIEDGVIKPCPKSNPLYDYEISFSTGYKYKVSIKNYDITIHEKAFKERCDIIRKTFINFLKRKESSGKIHVILENDILTTELLFNICCTIIFKFNNHGVYEVGNRRCIIFFNPLDEFKSSELNPSSDIVQITARKHFNENRNITDKIDKVNKQLFSDPEDHKSIKQLIIRLGATADFDLICNHIGKISSDWQRRGYDLVQVFQPQVVDDIENNKTSICTSLYLGDEMFYPLDQHMEEKMKKIKPFKMEFPTSSISMQSIPISFVTDTGKMNINLRPFYSYQQGDIYLKLKNNNDSYEGNLSRLYSGVLTHLVFKNVTISPIIFTKEDRLLIV